MNPKGNKLVNPFQPPAKRKKAKDEQKKKKTSATAHAIGKFALMKKVDPPMPQKPVASSSSKIAPKKSAAPTGATFITTRIPITFDKKMIVKLLERDPVMAAEVIDDIFDDNPRIAKRVIGKYERRQQLIEKYSFEKSSDEDNLDFFATDDPPPKEKPKPSVATKTEKDKEDEFIETREDADLTQAILLSLKAEKNSLPVDLAYVKSIDSKSKVKVEDVKLRFSNTNTRFVETLEAKFLNLACHCLPLMEDDSTLSKAQRNAICIASTGMVFDSLADFRDAFYLRSIHKKVFNDVYLKHLRVKPSSMKKRGNNHDKILDGIKKAQKNFKRGRKPTKMETIFLQLFPGFKSSPIYKA